MKLLSLKIFFGETTIDTDNLYTCYMQRCLANEVIPDKYNCKSNINEIVNGYLVGVIVLEWHFFSIVVGLFYRHYDR